MTNIYKLGIKDRFLFMPIVRTFISCYEPIIVILNFRQVLILKDADINKYVISINNSPWVPLIDWIQPYIHDDIIVTYPELIQFDKDKSIEGRKRLIRKNWRVIHYLKQEELNIELLLEAINVGTAQSFVYSLSYAQIKFISWRIPNLELIKRCVRYSIEFFDSLNFTDEQMCEILSVNGGCLSIIPSSRVTLEMCQIAIAQNPMAINFVPPALLDYLDQNQQQNQQQNQPHDQRPIKRNRPHIENALIEHAISQNAICPIFLIPITHDNVAVTICGHIFSRDALNETLLRSHQDGNQSVCPTCRELL